MTANVALPDSYYAPPHPPEYLVYFAVARAIPLNLRYPVLGIPTCRESLLSLPPMATVPEIAVAEDRNPLVCENQIGTAWQRLDV